MDGDLRLEGGVDNIDASTREGRIEICVNNAWGTVCNNSFNVPDARVACKQLIGFQKEGICQFSNENVCRVTNFYHIVLYFCRCTID